jgi:hypothetical protein
VTVLDLRERARPLRPELPETSGLEAMAIATWRGRMINEHCSAEVFEVLAEQLAELDDVPPLEIRRCREFAAEERHHGVLCGAVVEALGGRALAEAPELDEVPRHPEVGPREAALRNLLSICCLSETVAVSLIGAEREEMAEGELKELLTRIWADECGHSNFGWRLLPGLLGEDEALKQRLGAYLSVALAHLEEHELAHLPTAALPPGGEALGLCGGPGPRALFYATVERVIVPNLQALGLPAERAWAERAR